jgi:Icc-related predicted phosphoesterase
VIPGNHEFYPDYLRFILTNATHYLRDECVTLEGIKFYGSRFKPYNKWLPTGRSSDAKTSFNDIENEKDIDIFITHEPPYFSTQDRFFRCGNEYLTPVVLEKKPRVHIFGHDHHAYGTRTVSDIVFIAAASCNGRSNRKNLNKPIMFDFIVKN